MAMAAMGWEWMGWILGNSDVLRRIFLSSMFTLGNPLRLVTSDYGIYSFFGVP